MAIVNCESSIENKTMIRQRMLNTALVDVSSFTSFKSPLKIN